MAVGLTIEKENFELFKKLFEQCCQELLSEDDLNLTVDIDESILDDSINFDIIKQINMSTWGQGFNPPLYKDNFEVIEQSILGDKHTKCLISLNEQNYPAIFFNQTDNLPDRIEAIYSIESNEFRGNKKIQLILRDLI